MGKDGWCTLLHVVLAGADQLVPMLVAAGLDINARDSDGQTPLMKAARCNDALDLGSHRFEAINALLTSGADATLVHEAGNDALFLLQAARLETHQVNDENGELAAKLDTAEASLRAAGARGGNPADFQLLDAVRRGDAQGVRAALAAGARPDVRKTTMYNEYNVLALACGNDNVEIVRILLDAGADVNEGGKRAIPIARAAHMGHLEVVKLLLKRGADVNRCAPGDKDNALTYAKYSRNLEMIDYLRSVGARPPDEAQVPFEPGVEFPNTFTELLVKAGVGQAGKALAEALHGTLTADVWGKRFMATRICASVLQYEGSAWTSVLRASDGMGSIIDAGWEALAGRMSGLAQAPVILICHEDTSGCSAYRMYERGELVERYEEGLPELAEELADLGDVPAEVVSGAFFSKRGKKIEKEKMDKGHLVLRDLAQAEGFRAFNYGPAAMTGEEFDFEIMKMQRRLAGSGFVTA
jgi:ankyrin repeat protein